MPVAVELQGTPAPRPSVQVIEWVPDSSNERFSLDLRTVIALAQLADSSALNTRIREFLITKFEVNPLQTSSRWIHVESLDSVIDAKTATIYSPDYLEIAADRIKLKFRDSEIQVLNRYVSWR
jgi:hypothetical protein